MNTLRNLMLASALTLVTATASFAQPYDPDAAPGYRSYDDCGPTRYDSSGAPMPDQCD